MVKTLACGVALVAALGCGDKKSDTKAPPPGPKPAEPEVSCAEQTAELGGWLDQLAAEGGGVIASDTPLVALDRAPSAFDVAPVVTIEADVIRFNGMAVDDPRAVAKNMQRMLAAEREQIEADGATMDRLLLLVAPDATWVNVVDVAAAAASTGFTNVVFVFNAKSEMTPPPKSSISRELAELAKPADPAEAVQRLADAPKDGGLPARVYGKCQPVLDWMPSLADVAPGERSAMLVKTLPGKIAECDCNVEMAAVKSLHWAWMGRDTGAPTTSVAVALAPKGAKDPQLLTGAGHEQWSVAHKAIVDAPADTPLRLQAQ